MRKVGNIRAQHHKEVQGSPSASDLYGAKQQTTPFINAHLVITVAGTEHDIGEWEEIFGPVKMTSGQATVETTVDGPVPGHELPVDDRCDFTDVKVMEKGENSASAPADWVCGNDGHTHAGFLATTGGVLAVWWVP